MLEVVTLMGLDGVAQDAEPPVGIEVRASTAAEHQTKALRFVPELVVDEMLHDQARARSRRTTVSTWLVCGNSSTVVIEEIRSLAAKSGTRSRERVWGSQET